MAIERFEQLEVWQKGHELVLAIYRLTRTFPPEERFGLVTQMRRAAISVPANIAEGFKRRTLKDKIHFYNVSQGSLEETRYYLLLAFDLKYVTRFDDLGQLADHVARLLHGLIASIEKRRQ